VNQINNTLNKVVLGTAGLAGIWGAVDVQESIQTILRALALGITHFDTSPAYADAEEILGNALQQWHGERPFISTKVGKVKADNPDSVAYDFEPKAIKQSFLESLRVLKVNKIDLLYLHDPTGLKPQQIQPAIDAFKELKQAGLVNSIGIGGNYNPAFRPFVSKDNFDYFMGFNRFNLVNQLALEAEFPILLKEGIQIMQASPLYMGLLGNRFYYYQETKPSWILAEHLQKAAELNKYCADLNISLTGLALQYVLNASCLNKVVLGAKNIQELETSISFIKDQNLQQEAAKFLRNDQVDLSTIPTF